MHQLLRRWRWTLAWPAMVLAPACTSGGDDAGSTDTDETTEPTEDTEETEQTDLCDGGSCSAPTCGACDSGACERCATDGGEPDTGAPEAGPPDGPMVEVGVPDQETSLYFEQLTEDGEIDIRMGGQGGTHALIAIQCSGFGNRVLYQVEMTNLDADGGVATLPLPRPRPIACDDDGVCRISPIFVLLGGLADPDDWDGLHVEVTATVSNEDGLVASDTKTGYLDAD